MHVILGMVAYSSIKSVKNFRFYGDSHPTTDLSVENLVFLSSEQALADLANFVSSMNAEYNLTDAKWISFGGSYPGSLSAWFRLKYPHLGSLFLLRKSNIFHFC